MLNYEKLSEKASIFKTFTGLEVTEFDALYSKLEAVNPAYEEKRLARSDRKNKIGAGHPFKLNLKNRFLLLLLYYRLYVSSTFDRISLRPWPNQRFKRHTHVGACSPSNPAAAKENSRRNPQAANTRGGRSLLSRLQSVHRRHRAGDSKAKRKTKTQDTLQWQKEASHR